MTTYTNTSGQTETYRGIGSTKELLAAVADGFATVVGGEEYVREGTTNLVNVSFTTRQFEALSTMLVSKANARRMGLSF